MTGLRQDTERFGGFLPGGQVRIEPDRPTASHRRLPLAGRIAIVLLLAYALLALVGPHIAPYDPTEVFLGGPLEQPSASFWLGTDNLGRDVASRFLHGGRSILITACGAALLSTLLGGAIGILLALKGGVADEIGMRICETLMSLPAIIVALLVIGFVGADGLTVIVTVGLLSVPNVARVARAAAVRVASEDYVEAARARGEGTVAIAIHEVLANVRGTLVVEFSIRTGFSILFISGLGFLGFGVAPPAPDWGLMINEGRTTLGTSIWPLLAPAAGIAVLVTAVNLLTDALETRLAPDAGGEDAPWLG